MSDAKEASVCLGAALNHLLDRDTRLGKGKKGGLVLPILGQRGGEMSVVLISGTPGSGKSTLALQMATQAAKSGIDSLYLSLEDHPVVIKKKAQTFGRDNSGTSSWADYVFEPTNPHVGKDEASHGVRDSSDRLAAIVAAFSSGFYRPRGVNSRGAVQV